MTQQEEPLAGWGKGGYGEVSSNLRFLRFLVVVILIFGDFYGSFGGCCRGFGEL